MPRQTKLPAALKKFGLKVKLVDGYATRGSASFNPKGSIGHHTAGPKTGDRPSLNVCVNGRPRLSGPLCNTFLPRGLTPSEQYVYVVALGRANHAGAGGFRGLVGNSSVFGTEAEDDGLDGIWTPWQRWAFPRVMAAQLWVAGRDETWYASHRTWTPRKIDPTGISDSWMRSEIKQVFAEVLGDKKPTPPPVLEEKVKREDADVLWGADLVPVTTTSTAKKNPTWSAKNALGSVFDSTRRIEAILKSQETTIKALTTAVLAKGDESNSAEVKAAFDEGVRKLQEQLTEIKVTVGYDAPDSPPAS